MTYLREKNERLQEFRKEELEVKRMQLEKEENFMKVKMSQQQQQQKQMQEFQAMMNMQVRQQSDLMLALVIKLIDKH